MAEYKTVQAYGDDIHACCKKAVKAHAHHVCEFDDRLVYVCGDCLIEMIQMAGQQGDGVLAMGLNPRNWTFQRKGWITQIEVKI